MVFHVMNTSIFGGRQLNLIRPKYLKFYPDIKVHPNTSPCNSHGNDDSRDFVK